MPSFRTAFPSKYLKASDLGLNRPVVTVKSVTLETVGSDSKWVVRFREPGYAALVLNLTNSRAIAELAGSEDTTDWIGVRIGLYPSKTDYAGRRVDCIRLEPPAKPARIAAREPGDDDIDTAFPDGETKVQ